MEEIQNTCDTEEERSTSLVTIEEDTTNYQDWQKDDNVIDIRKKMMKRIMSVLEETVIFEDSINWFAQAPTMAKNIESILFHQENNLEDYVNEKSLYNRLELIARARLLGNSKEAVSESSNRKINGSETENLNNSDGSITIEKKNRALKDQQQRLLLLRHASKCHFNDEGQCSITPQCFQMKLLWDHLQNCRNNSCSYSHCMSSRYVLEHFSKCKNLRCPLCGPIVVCSRRTDFVSPDQLPTVEEVRNHINKSSNSILNTKTTSSSNNFAGDNPLKRVKVEFGSETTATEPSEDSSVPPNYYMPDFNINTSSIASATVAAAPAAATTSIAVKYPKAVKSNYNFESAYIAKLRCVEDPAIALQTTVPAKAVIMKSWRVHNDGPAPWPTDINIVFAGGDRMEFVGNACWAAVEEKNLQGDRYFAVSVKAPSESGRHISLFHLTTGASPGGRSLWTGPRMKLDITVENEYQEGIETSEESAPYDRLAVLVHAASSAEREYSERPAASSTAEGDTKDICKADEQEEDDEDDDDDEQAAEQVQGEGGKIPERLMKKNIFKERMSAADMVSKYESYAKSQLSKVRYINNAHERKVALNLAGMKRAAESLKDDLTSSGDDDNEGAAASEVVEYIAEKKIDQAERTPMESVTADTNASSTVVASLSSTSTNNSTSSTSLKRAGKIKVPQAAAPVPPPLLVLPEVTPPALPSDVSPAASIEVPVDQSTSAKRKRGRPTLAAAAAAVTDASSPPPRPSTVAATSTEGGKKGKKTKKMDNGGTDTQLPTESDSINNSRLLLLACLSTRQE